MRRSHWMILIASIALVCAILAGVLCFSLKDEVDNLQSDLYALGSINAELQQEIDQLSASQTETDTAVQTLSADLQSDQEDEGEPLYTELNELLTVKNLFDADAITPAHYVSSANGSLYASDGYNASDYIPVESGAAYTVSNNRMLAFYDDGFAYVGGMEGDGENTTADAVTFTVPDNAAYLRVSVAVAWMGTFSVERGSVLTAYEPYQRLIDSDNIRWISDDSGVLLFLPDEICIAAGRTIELYNSQVSWGADDACYFQWTCDVGNALEGKWSCAGTEDKIGEYPLTCTIYNNTLMPIATATTTVKIVPDTIPSTLSVLPIGDSLTNGKPWLSEVRRLSGDRIRFVGTRWTGDADGGDLNHEGRSGVSSAWYLINSSYTYELNGAGIGNPFYSAESGRFDWNYYKTTTGLDPDAVLLFLGTNGITVDPTVNAGNIQQIVDYIRQDDPAIPVYVTFTLYRGDQNGLGASEGQDLWKAQEDRKVFNLMTEVYALLHEVENLYFVPVALTHDSANNFATTERTVNPRAAQTEAVQVEAVHPLIQGYMQFADIIFSTIAAHQ